MLLIFTTVLNLVCPGKCDTILVPISRYHETSTTSSSSPTAIKTDLQVSYFAASEFSSVRIVYDSLNKIFYTNTFSGDIYRIRLINGIPQNRELFLSSSNHLINRMQGLLFYNSALYLVGNEAEDQNKRGRGRVIKFPIDASGNWGSPTYMLGTDYYASSTTLFDHAFSAISLNSTKDSLYIASGSRTDHGEIKDLGGTYPNLREEPLTTKIFRIPLNTSNEIYLLNDENFLQNSGYVYCEGVRNAFDLALNGKGELFGVENMGDRDDPEELNLLVQGKHYGFPWKMGGNLTPQQFSPYNPENDLLLPDNLSFPEIFHNDPTFPLSPSGIVFEEPIRNLGPDANWVRNPNTGTFFQSNNITTFTSHRSPLGFNIDSDSLIGYPYTASGFVLAYSVGGGTSGYLNPIDSGGDLCEIKFVTNSIGKYEVEVTKLIQGFDRVVDAVLVKNEMYVLEETGNIYKVTFPLPSAPISGFTYTIDNNCKKRVIFNNTSYNNFQSIVWDFGDGEFSSELNPTHIYDITGEKTVILTLSNAHGSDSKTVLINIPDQLELTGPQIIPKISGVGYLSTDQHLDANIIQELYAEKSIEMNTGFQTNEGTVFSTKITTGCQ